MATRPHPYALLGGGEGNIVHGPPSIYIERDPWLILPGGKETFAKERFAEVPVEKGSTKTFKLYYSRCWGGEYRSRLRDEPDPPISPNTKRVVLIQGLAGTHAQFESQVRYLTSECPDAKDFDVVALDCRGVGLSETPSALRWTTTGMANDIVELVRTIPGWEENGVHLLGFSLGGMIALECALAAPRMWKSVTLVCTHPGGPLGTVVPPWGIPTTLKIFSSLGTVDSMNAGGEILFPPSYLDREISVADNPRLAKAAARCLGSNAPVTNRFKVAMDLVVRARKYVEGHHSPEILLPGVIRQITAVVSHRVGWDRLEYLRCSGIKFLIVAGEQDLLVTNFNSQVLASALDAPLFYRKEAAHGILDQCDAELNPVLAEHFRSSQASGAAIEGRPALPVEGPRPGEHPLRTMLVSGALACALLLRDSESRASPNRVAAALAVVALALRVVHGPLWRVSRPVKYI